MKQLIVMIAMSVSILASAQDMAMVTPAELVASGTYFETAPTDKKWGNTTTNRSTSAKFARYDGITYVKLISYKMQVEALLEYEVNLKGGKLEMIVVNEKDEVLWSRGFLESGSGNMTVLLEPYEEYRVKFIGKGAKGSYDCKWKSL